MVAGYFDAEDFYGPLELYHKYETQDPKHLVRLVIGPWYHGEWSRSPDGRLLGRIDFGENTSRWFRDQVQAPWFAHWLKGKARPTCRPCWPSEPARIAGSDTMRGRRGRRSRNANSICAPMARCLPSRRPARIATRGDHDDYVSDPAKPVPYFPRPITDDDWAEWQMADQRFVDGRPDVLTYESEPLKEDITVSGDPVAHLFAATSGSDADWVVKLIDVYPEDYAQDPTCKAFSSWSPARCFARATATASRSPKRWCPAR